MFKRVIFLISLVSGVVSVPLDQAPLKCNLPPKLVEEIHSYKSVVQLIKEAVVDDNGPLKNSTWVELANFVDDYGSRLAGTQNLENAIDFLLTRLKSAKLDNVHGENASVPRWVRGDESAMLVSPRKKPLSILGLGSSVGTPKTGITAPVIVVRSLAELEQKALEVAGKIVVFNEEYVSYGETVEYRSNGATEASKYGAVAALIRSVGPFSLNTPHTGAQSYGNAKPIPAACITIEDAQMLQRLYNRGKQLEIHLKMDAHLEKPAISRNVIAEIVGKSEPKKVVLVSGHVDSWDVGQGAMDDGGGAFISWKSLEVLRYLQLRPRRTIRAVLWTGEEEGYFGARGYLKDHQNEMSDLTAAIESDEGTFTPTGLVFYGTKEAACIMQEIVKQLEPLNATFLELSKEKVGSDIELFQNEGVPGISLRNKNENYFWFHHTQADMMTVEDPLALDLGTAVFSAVTFILADMSAELPRPSMMYHM